MVCSLHSVTTGSRDRANVPLIIITITVWEVRAAPGFYLPANLYMDIVDNTAEPYTVLHLSVLVYGIC